MKISKVKVGMKLKSIYANDILSPITVTEITEKGFKYSIEKEKPHIAREGSYFAKAGHEAYSINGEVLYEELKQKTYEI